MSGKVTAVCTPLHVGGSMASFQIEISDEQRRRTCTARLTCAYLHTRPNTPSHPGAEAGAQPR